MECDGFKNVSWGGFLLDSSGNVAGTLTSKQLLNAENTSMGLVFDPTTGLLSVKTLEGTDSSGETVAASDEVVVDAAVEGLSIKSGNYGFCMIDMQGDDINKANKGEADLSGIDFDGCAGRSEQYYVKYNSFNATTGSLPSMEVWKSETDRNSCYVNDTLTFQISDGSRSLSFTEGNVKFDDVFNAIYNSGTSAWAPSAAVESYQISLAENAGEKGETAEFKANLESMFGTGNACSGIVDALITAYNKTKLITDKGFKRCSQIVVDTGNPNFDNEMNSGEGPPPEWCVDYLEATDDTAKTTAKNRFIAECKAHIEGDGGESLWQKQALVQEFFQILSESRHEGGDGRNSSLRDAFDLAEQKGITMTATDLAALSESCNASAEADKALAALALAWSELDHNWERQRFLRGAIDKNGNLICTTISIDNFGRTITYANGRALMKSMLTKKFNTHDQRVGLEDLKQQVCEDSHEMDLSGIDTSASYFTTFWSNIDSTQNEPQFKSTVTDKTTPFLTFVTHLLDNNIVRGCTKSHMTNVKTALSDTSATGGNSGPGGPDEFIRWIGWQILDQKRRAALDAINTSPTSGTSPLTALDTSKSDAARRTAAATELPAFATKVANLAVSDPMRFGWLLMDLCQFVDLGTLSLDVSGVSCGQPLPSSLSAVCGGGGNCTLRRYEVRNEDQHLILSDLARRITEIKGRDAFRTDKTFKETMRTIKARSSCLPDATISHNPTLDANNSLTFEIGVRAPLAMMMHGEVNKQPQFSDDVSSENKFIIESSRIEQNEGGMGSASCYWGEIKRFRDVVFNSTDDSFKGVFTEAFVDTCRNANSSDSGDSGDSEEDSEHSWHRKFVATYEPTGSKSE